MIILPEAHNWFELSAQIFASCVFLALVRAAWRSAALARASLTKGLS